MLSALLVPVFLALVECREHDGQDGGHIVTDEAEDVLIVPEVQSSLCHLEGMRVERGGIREGGKASKDITTMLQLQIMHDGSTQFTRFQG